MKKTAQQSDRREERPAAAPARTPPPPHGHPLTRSKPEDRVHPAERKSKHKRRPGDGE
jgi:hypothetical protein